MQITIKAPPLHPGQQKIFDCEARFIVACCGRRFGKTRVGSRMCLKYAIAGKKVWWIAPQYSMAAIGWEEVKHLASQIPGVTIKDSERIAYFPGGGWIQSKSADAPHTLRGRGLDFVVLDEAAFIKPETWTGSIRPALADRKGKALFISTPMGKNWFYHLWTNAVADGKEWKAFRYPTSANPYIDRSEIEAARNSTTEKIFREEWLAQFVDDNSAVFRNVRACRYVGREQYHLNGRYVAGVDLAMSNDFSVITVFDRATNRVVDIDRFNQVSWTIQRARIAAMADRWNPTVVWVEENSIGAPNIEELQKLDINVKAFQTTNESKSELIDDLVYAFETEQIALPVDHPLCEVVVGELEAFEMERLPSGRWRYGAPEGLHDDTVMSLALAYRGKKRHGGKIVATISKYA